MKVLFDTNTIYDLVGRDLLFSDIISDDSLQSKAVIIATNNTCYVDEISLLEIVSKFSDKEKLELIIDTLNKYAFLSIKNYDNAISLSKLTKMLKINCCDECLDTAKSNKKEIDKKYFVVILEVILFKLLFYYCNTENTVSEKIKSYTCDYMLETFDLIKNDVSINIQNYQDTQSSKLFCELLNKYLKNGVCYIEKHINGLTLKNYNKNTYEPLNPNFINFLYDESDISKLVPINVTQKELEIESWCKYYFKTVFNEIQIEHISRVIFRKILNNGKYKKNNIEDTLILRSLVDNDLLFYGRDRDVLCTLKSMYPKRIIE